MEEEIELEKIEKRKFKNKLIILYLVLGLLGWLIFKGYNFRVVGEYKVILNISFIFGYNKVWEK